MFIYLSGKSPLFRHTKKISPQVGYTHPTKHRHFWFINAYYIILYYILYYILLYIIYDIILCYIILYIIYYYIIYILYLITVYIYMYLDPASFQTHHDTSGRPDPVFSEAPKSYSLRVPAMMK